MSILILEPAGRLGEVTTRHLIDEGDEVRVLITEDADRWKRSGAYVASGPTQDEDLVERACRNVRTVVVHEPATGRIGQGLKPVLEAAARAGVGRAVVVSSRRDPSMEAILESLPLDFVLMTSSKGSLPWRKVADEHVAVAISAADDLTGNPRMTVDLGSDEGWKSLKLERPD